MDQRKLMSAQDQRKRLFLNTICNITCAETIEKAEGISSLTSGYITGLRINGAINAWQYLSMKRLLYTALSIARERAKKYASGAANTESGKSNLTIFSIAALCTIVKGEVRRNAE
jgi:hypothetical protein